MDNILQYVDKLFFYCLKKCKDRNDAEELSSQVILEVLIAINNNRKINDLESQAAKLSQSTRASSLGATETLFEMPNWRKNSTIK